MSKNFCNIRSINLNELSPFNKEDLKKCHKGNLIRHSITKDNTLKTSVAESELHRILKCLEGKSPLESNLDSIISLNVGKNVKKYDYLIERKGYLKLAKYECKYECEYDKKTKKIKTKKNGIITHRFDKEVEVFKSMLTGAGHSRNCKSLFIRTDIVNKMNKILLCGIPYNTLYKRPAKWNAYYAMCTTDSEPVTSLPNIIVIDDYEKNVIEYVDEVEEYVENENGRLIKKYKVNNNVKRKVVIKPFDGAGVVTPQCAARWALELNIRNNKGKRYLPSAFQFRAIPGIKGELYVIDIYRFMKEKNVRYIRDIWGRLWDLQKHRIDCILTKSQFKFYDLYNSFEHWESEFVKEIYGYKRTFNIASYAEDVEDLKKVVMLSYQPLQTLMFKESEIHNLSSYGVDLLTRISTDINEFIKYRGMLAEDEKNLKSILPPYYQALYKCKELFNDKYIYGKIQEDIQKLRNNLLAGKVIVRGNYQTLTPDILGLLQYAFGLPVEGLLRKGQIYSNYWSGQRKEKVDIIRNPHINMEHRIGYLRKSKKMDRWYEYQTTGILTSMYDTYLLALGGADTDGDHVCCIPDCNIIDAVIREIKSGNGRTVIFKGYSGANGSKGINVNNTSALMKVNKDSFSNDIGSVINEISKLWSLKLSNEIRDAIKICSCIGALVIDFAKTGEKAEIPKEIKELLKGIKKPYFMRYLSQNLELAKREDNAIKKAYLKYGKNIDTIGKLYQFQKPGSGNMDRLCMYMEQELNTIGNLNIQMNKDFNYAMLLSENGRYICNQKVRKKIYGLQAIYKSISQEKNMDKSTGKDLEREYKSRYRYFFEYSKSELLSLGVDVNELIDVMVIIFYTDKQFVSESKQKDVLWNTFGEELVKRCENDFSIDEEKMLLLKKRKKKNFKMFKKQVLEKQKKRTTSVSTLDKYFDNIATITTGDRQMVNNMIKLNEHIKNSNKIDACRLYMELIMIARKTGSYKIIKYFNRPNDITDLTLSKLAGIDRRKIDTLLAWFDQEGFIETEVLPNSNVSIVLNFDEYVGDIWIQDIDYNTISSNIRDYYRK